MKIRENIKVAITCTILPWAIAFMLYRHSHFKSALAVIAIFLTIAALSLIIPKFGIYIHETASKLFKFVGNILSKIILFFVYILAVIPTGVLMKLVKRDRLRLKKPDVSTYFTDCEQKQHDYEYQF